MISVTWKNISAYSWKRNVPVGMSAEEMGGRYQTVDQSEFMTIMSAPD